ncbi:MAG: restriction endonuclease subunit S, partial [Chloroflexi bacterium]|nr:restriction endonuclease subunit S [Chloroflexota bacterium]
KPVIVSPLYGVFIPDNYALGTILDAFFESPQRTNMYLEPLTQKGAKNTINITNTRFLEGYISLPRERKEQQKIADCLSSLDQVIELEAKRLEALKAHKKGLLQQLFPQEAG